MTTAISALTRNIRRHTRRLVARPTRRATIKLAITTSLPPFLKIVFAYEVKAAANDNGRHRRHRPA